MTDGAGVGSAGGATFLVGCLSFRPTRGPVAEVLFPGPPPGIGSVGWQLIEWLIFDSERHRARVQAESTSMNKLRPLNKAALSRLLGTGRSLANWLL
jgi:hypothetical protein